MTNPGVVPFFGATIVGPIISNLMEEVMTYLDVAPQFTEEELAEQDVAVPQLTGYTSAEARTTLSRMGLGTKVIGGDGTVEMQIPAYGQTIPYTGTVILYTNGSVPDDNITVPNLKDMDGVRREYRARKPWAQYKNSGQGPVRRGRLRRVPKPGGGNRRRGGNRRDGRVPLQNYYG